MEVQTIKTDPQGAEFPLYDELIALKDPQLSEAETITALSKVKQLKSDQSNIIYAIIQTYAWAHSKKQRSAKLCYEGVWISPTGKQGVKFRTKKLPKELKRLIAVYILYITGNPRLLELPTPN